MDFSLDQIFGLIKSEPGHGMVNSILLMLIWLNVRSLKNSITAVEEKHETRIGFLESKLLIYENRLTVLENHK